jgi:hypothetical protein
MRGEGVVAYRLILAREKARKETQYEQTAKPESIK